MLAKEEERGGDADEGDGRDAEGEPRRRGLTGRRRGTRAKKTASPSSTIDGEGETSSVGDGVGVDGSADGAADASSFANDTLVADRIVMTSWFVASVIVVAPSGLIIQPFL
jgi:hypothetical protein